MALGLVNLTNAFDPAAFVLGGGLAEGAHLYLEPIQRWFGELLYAPDRRPHPGCASPSSASRPAPSAPPSSPTTPRSIDGAPS